MPTRQQETKTKKFLKALPHLPVKNLQATLDYYRDELGFTDEWTIGTTDGGIRRDNLRLLFAEDSDFVHDMNKSKHRLPLIWFVDDIDSIYQELKARGIELADDLRMPPYGLREFAFIDINGYYIRIAEGKEEVYG